MATVMIASYGSSTIVSDGATASSPAGPVLPDFSEPIRNVTVPLGREAVLSCVISNLAEYKVTWTFNRCHQTVSRILGS